MSINTNKATQKWCKSKVTENYFAGIFTMHTNEQTKKILFIILSSNIVALFLFKKNKRIIERPIACWNHFRCVKYHTRQDLNGWSVAKIHYAETSKIIKKMKHKKKRKISKANRASAIEYICYAVKWASMYNAIT